VSEICSLFKKCHTHFCFTCVPPLFNLSFLCIKERGGSPWFSCMCLASPPLRSTTIQGIRLTLVLSRVSCASFRCRSSRLISDKGHKYHSKLQKIQPFEFTVALSIWWHDWTISFDQKAMGKGLAVLYSSFVSGAASGISPLVRNAPMLVAVSLFLSVVPSRSVGLT